MSISLLHALACWKSMYTEGCATKLSQALAHNIDNGVMDFVDNLCEVL